MSADRTVLATSFRPDEVHALCAMLERLQRGADVTVIARTPAARRLHAKFLRMRDKGGAP